MAKKFITTRELNLIDSWNKELIQGVVQQEVIYYGISYEESQIDDVYDESIRKEYYQPVRFMARVEFKQDTTTSAGGTLDSNYSLSVQAHKKELDERNIRPREGHFIEHGGAIFEITSVGISEPVFGQINDKLLVEISCVPSREGQFKAENISFDGVDNTHPVNPRRPRTLGDGL